MYIISLDLGTTNSKAVVMKIENDNIVLVGKVKSKSVDFALFISEVLNKYNIKKEDIEKIVMTGTGASYVSENESDFDILKVNEFEAVGYGGIILAKLEEGLVVSIGTGTSIVYSNLDKVSHIGGTGLGGGTLVGLGRRLLSIKKKEYNNDDPAPNFKELIELAKKGDHRNVDLTIADVNNGDIDNLTSDITAANIAAIDKVATDADYMAGVINMIAETIGLLIKAYNVKKLPVVLIGTMVTDSYVHSVFDRVSDFTGDKYCYINDADYAIAIGAYEYYLLRLRKNI